MPIETLWPRLHGYVIIMVKGRDLEGFLNSVVERSLLWDVERLNEDTMVARVTVRGFRQLRGLGRRTGVRVTVVRRVGVPFFLQRLASRKSLVVGALACLVTLYFLSMHIWIIDVEGVDGPEARRVRQVIAAMGLRPGAAKFALDREEIGRELLIRVDDLAWATVDFQGTRALVRAAEKVVPNPEQSIPGHIVARKAAVIAKIVPLRGTAVVREGETVRQGQMLISGMLKLDSAEFKSALESGDPPYIHADGIVQARVWYEGLGEAKAEEVREIETGKSYVSRTLIVNGRPGFQWGTDSPFERSRVDVSQRRLSLFGRGEIIWQKRVFHQLQTEVRHRTPAQMKQAALDRARADVGGNLDRHIDILTEEVEWLSESPEEVKVRLLLETVENIKRFEPLDPGEATGGGTLDDRRGR